MEIQILWLDQYEWSQLDELSDPKGSSDIANIRFSSRSDQIQNRRNLLIALATHLEVFFIISSLIDCRNIQINL